MVKNLPLSTGQVAAAVGTCPTAATRKVEACEDLLDLLIRAARRVSPTARRDRMTALLVARLRTVSMVVTRHPEQFEQWIGRLVQEVR